MSTECIGGTVISSAPGGDLVVKCSCGHECNGGGLAQIYIPVLKIFISQHKKKGHEVQVRDPDNWLDKYEIPGMIS